MVEFIYDKKKHSFISLSEGDHLIKRMKKNESFYEDFLLEKIKSFNLNGVYVDCGANIGNHSIFFAHHCNSEKVISIEISDIIFKILEINLNNNYSDKYIRINCGVGEKNKFVDICEIDEKNSGSTKIISNKGDYKINTLDSILSEYKNITLIKLDIEDYELNAMQGAENILKEQQPIIISELRDKESFYRFKLFIERYGYKTDGVNYASTPTFIWKT